MIMDAQAKTVTMDYLESLVVAEDYLRSPIAPTLTICVLALKNGYSVRGEAACADPRMFDEQKGREIARRDAISQAWPLEGYLLRQQLHETQTDQKTSAATSPAAFPSDSVELQLRTEALNHALKPTVGSYRDHHQVTEAAAVYLEFLRTGKPSNK